MFLPIFEWCCYYRLLHAYLTIDQQQQKRDKRFGLGRRLINDGNSKYHETKVIRLDALTHVNYNSFSHSRSDIQPRQSEQRQNLQIKNLLDEDICI